MKRILAAAALLSLSGFAAQAQAQAQTPAPAAPQAPASAPLIGVTPEALIAWLTTQGATAGPLQQDGERRYIRVQTEGLPWLLFLASCEGGACSDIQFSAGLTNAGVTADKINAWNRDRRFLKAIYEVGEGAEPSSAVVQYDVLLNSRDPAQLTDHLAIWRNLLPEFVRTIAPAAPSPGG